MLQHKSLRSVQIQRVQEDRVLTSKDHVAVEQFLELHLIHGYHQERQRDPLLVTMCSPGHEMDLAIGMLFHLGIVSHLNAVLDIRFCPFTQTRPDVQVLVVELEPEVTVNEQHLKGRQWSNSACGLCGAHPDQLDSPTSNVFPVEWQVSAKDLYALPALLMEHQALFQLTGGIHAAAYISLSLSGQALAASLSAYREDVGRHNALDKVIGHTLRTAQWPLDRGLLLMSSRASFELLDKAQKAGIHFLATIGAPSSLAVDLAKASNMTLVGFLKSDKFNVYAGAARISS
ncbi:MAG: formate dehydrogenase accessory sulfurtransferase FdhD [Bacteroidota bacterium]